jgi:AraC-like DNA-binding protein
MSRSAFAARFTQTFGRTPLNLLKSERLRRSRELLATTNAPVDQMARSGGIVLQSSQETQNPPIVGSCCHPRTLSTVALDSGQRHPAR